MKTKKDNKPKKEGNAKDLRQPASITAGEVR